MIGPETYCLNRIRALHTDLRRMEILLEEELVQRLGDQQSALIGRFNLTLSPLFSQVEKLEQMARANTPASELWPELTALQTLEREALKLQLEFLGGISIVHGIQGPGSEAGGLDQGFAIQAESWLNEVRERVGLDRALIVIAGRGPVLEEEAGIVRLPFLDWDLWHLPLLARAVGLLAGFGGTGLEKALQIVTGPVIEQVDSLLERDAADPPADLMRLLPELRDLWRAYAQYAAPGADRARYRQANAATAAVLRERQKVYFNYFFADQFATAVIGPVYALAVFALELDYRNPELPALLDPDLIEGRATAPRYLPSPVERAAAMLATLRAINDSAERPAYQDGPYDKVVAMLERMWRELVESNRKPDTLGSTIERFAPWHTAVYQQVLAPLLRKPIQGAQDNWRLGQAWYQALRGETERPEPNEPSMTALLSAMWLHRLEYPNLADEMLSMGADLLDKNAFVPLAGRTAALGRAVAQARFDGLDHQRQRLQAILLDKQISEADRAAVSGRLFRLMSQQLDRLEAAKLGLRGQDEVRASVWGKLEELEEKERPTRREALEYLGGLLVHYLGFDREPSQLTQMAEAGPSVCALADAILRVFALQTGVNWSARTILGEDPLLALETDVIRVRFPDWSVWNLPLMAHEFGHLASFATPEFMRFVGQEEQNPIPENTVRNYRRPHLYEFFADLFATYTFGPAFVTDVVLLNFNPAEAYRARGGHPTHDERIQVIMLTLGAMNDAAREGSYDPGPYRALMDKLAEAWEAAKIEAGAVQEESPAADARAKEVRRWWRALYRQVVQSYRLGAGYTIQRWRFAQELGESLLHQPLPTPEKIQQLALQHAVDEALPADLLNALWYARVELAGEAYADEYFDQAAHVICSQYLRTLV